MELPNNCQCYCYAIMSSLCFPCQVKIHLLHLTASPHGELMKCQTTETGTPSSQTRTVPKDRAQTPRSAGNDLPQTPNSPNRLNDAKPDCDKCYYYMNFINKLTSGLCEENIMRMVCSNPCLISSDHPATAGNPPSKPGPDVHFSRVMDNGYTSDANNKRIPSIIRVRSNTSTGTKDKQHPVQLAMEDTTTIAFRNNQALTADNLTQEMWKKGPEKKPTTPANLMTTDKMLRKSFDSISKNRPSQISSSSRSPSPRNKLPEIKQTSLKVDHNVSKSTSKNVSKQAKNDVRVSAQQRNSPMSTLKSSPKNEPTMQRQIASKEVDKGVTNSDGRRSVVSGKIKQTENSKMGTGLQNSRAAGKMIEKLPDPGPGGLPNTGEGHHTTHATEKGPLKTAEQKKQPSGAIEMGVDKNTPMDGFYEAALVMEFHQPPLLGPQHTGTDFKQQPTENDISNKKEYCNQPNSSEQEGSNKKQTTHGHSPIQYTIPEEFLEESSLVRDCITGKNKVPVKSKSSNSSTKKEMAEDKSRKKSRTSDSKRHDLPSWKGTSQAPTSAQMKSHVVGPEAFETYNDKTPYDTPVRDSLIGRDLCEYEPDFERTCSDDAIYRVERDRHPMYVSIGRDVQDECPQGESPTKATTEVNNVRKTSESRRNSMNNNIKKVDKQRYAYECSPEATYMTDRMGGVSSTNNGEDESPKWKNDGVREDRAITKGAKQGLKPTPNVSQRRRQDRQKLKTNDIGKDQVDHTDQIGEPSDRREVDTKERRGRLSDQESCGAPFHVGVVKKIREEIVSQYTQKLADKRKYNTETLPTQNKAIEKNPNPSSVARASPKDDRSSRSRSPIQKKSRSLNHRQGSTSGTSMDDVTKVYPQFSEYMNPDTEGYRSKSAGNIVECHSTPELDVVPPAKSRSERGSSKWSRGVCSNDKRVYYHTDSDGQCTSMVIGLPQDGDGSNPHIRINFNKQINREIICCKVDKCEQKNDYRDTGTQCENDIAETNSPAGSRPASVRRSKNQIPPKTTTKPLQVSEQRSSIKPTQTSSHQQMYYNRPLMRRSFQ